jgi:hypothetical protein
MAPMTTTSGQRIRDITAATLVANHDQPRQASLIQQPCRLDGGPTQLHDRELAHKTSCAHRDPPAVQTKAR